MGTKLEGWQAWTTNGAFTVVKLGDASRKGDHGIFHLSGTHYYGPNTAFYRYSPNSLSLNNVLVI